MTNQAKPFSDSESPPAIARIRALDFTRAFTVLLLFLSFVPEGPLYGSFITHAAWFGFTAVDFTFPGFVTVFGASMALAYRKGVPWKRLLRRTVLFILLGLLYNALELWQFDLSHLRFTGVLQVFAVIGIGTAILTRISDRWFVTLATGLVILTSYLYILVITSQSYPGGLPQPGYNLSAVYDPLIFTNNHIYEYGNSGHDPEGIVTMFSGIASVLLGYTAGQLLMSNPRYRGALKVAAFAVGLLLLTPILSTYIPICKRLWTPSFVTLTSGSTLLFLALSHMLWGSSSNATGKLRSVTYWFFEAIGRNAFLLYFGSSLLSAMLHHITVLMNGHSITLFQIFYEWINSWSTNPQLSYALIFSGAWILLALILHWRKLYIRL